MSKRVRFKAEFKGELRVFSLTDLTFQALDDLFAKAYSTPVVIRYDDEGDWITIRSQSDLEIALEGCTSTFRVVLSPDPSRALERDFQDELGKLERLANEAAATVHARAVQLEPEVTRLVQQLAFSVSGELVGMAFRLKGLESLTRKLYSGAKKKLRQAVNENRAPNAAAALADVASNIKDSMRYTMVFPTQEYTEGVTRVLDDLHAIVEIKQVKNYWIVATNEPSSDDYVYTPTMRASPFPAPGSPASPFTPSAAGQPPTSPSPYNLTSVVFRKGEYKLLPASNAVYDGAKWEVRRGDEYQGINSVLAYTMRTPVKEETVVLELQFHTPESLETKHYSHLIYSEFRVEKDPIKKNEQYQEMVEMWDSVIRPAGVETIGQGVGYLPAEELPSIPLARAKEWRESQHHKKEALVAARKLLGGWVASREEIVLTALFKYLVTKYQCRMPETDMNQRLLSKYPLRWKITQIAEERQCSFKEAAALAKECLQYVVIVREQTDFVTSVTAFVRDLERNHQSVDHVTNFWTQSAHAQPQRGVEFVLRTEHARLYSVHFHTETSHEMRTKAHRALRAMQKLDDADAAEKERHEQDIREACRDVDSPAGIHELTSWDVT